MDKIVQLLDPHLADLARRPLQAIGQVTDARDEFGLHRHHALARNGRRPRPQIGHVVAERDVAFVPHGGDHRNFGFRNGPHDGFLVEGPEVLDRPTAASDDQHVRTPSRIVVHQLPVEEADARDHALHRAFALHLDGIEANLDVGEAAVDHIAHVVDHRARGRGHDADAMRQERQRPPKIRMVELVEPLRLQLRLQRVELGHAFADLVLLQSQSADLEGILSPLHVQIKFTLDLDLEPVDLVLALRELGLERLVAPLEIEGEEHAADRRVLVLEREVAVSRGVDLVPRDLALDPRPGDLLVVREQIPPYGQRQLRDAIDPLRHLPRQVV